MSLITNDNLIELQELSAEERELALKILKEYAMKGSSNELNNLLYEDYEEIPVTIQEFLHNKKYLGRALINEEGKYTVFPYWEKVLNDIFPTNIDTAYNTAVFTGAIGLGKSTIAVIAMLYQLYRMMCLKNPYTHYGLQEIDLITFAFINITLDAAKGVAWDKCQQMLQKSDWFMQRGTVSKSMNPTWLPPKGIELITGSMPRHIIGRAVFGIFADEISFQPNQDVEAQKRKASELVEAASARMQSRFMHGEKNPTLMLLASSKRTEQSYLETFIENKRKNESKTTLVVDEPQWIIRTDKDSPNKFYVAVGNKFLDSEVLPLNISESDLDIYRNKGYTLLQVPMGYRENFVDDLDIALTDIAGISTSNTSKYISGPRLVEIKDRTLQNPFSKDVIEVGDGDNVQYSEFFDIQKVDRRLMEKPLYIHLDMSISGDKTGIAGVWQSGLKVGIDGEHRAKEMLYQLAFSVSIKAPKGYQISFEKNRQFIRWLREQGFNIRGISSDTFQSAQIMQQLKAENFNTTILSVDRVDSESKMCLPYQYLKSTIYDKRLKMYDSKLLTDELIGLERHNNGKIDHSPSSINCFTGDTKVRLLDGRSVSMVDLCTEYIEGKINYVYSFNHFLNRIEPKKILNAWCSGKNAKLVEVTLDNEKVIKCTPEHRFMMRDGSYKEAQELKELDSLMPLYTKQSEKGLRGYRLYYEPLEEEWHYEHRRFATEVYDEKYLVHHIDCNKLNNSPTNLIWMSKSSHTEIHASTNTGAQSEESRKKRAESVTSWHALNKDNPEYWTRYAPYRDMGPEEAMDAHKSYEKAQLEKKLEIQESHEKYLEKIKQQKQKQEDMANYYGIDLNSLTGTQLQALMIKYAHVIDPSYQKKVTESVVKRHKEGMYNNAYIALQKCNEARKGKPRPKEVIEKMKATKEQHGPYVISESTRKKLSEITSKKRWFTNGETNIYINPEESDVPSDYYAGRTVTWKNHKVVSVKFLDYTEDVYDLEIEDNHNFALDSGVFVHNSKDSSDALCGALYNASQHIEEYAYEYGEDIDNIVNVSSYKSETDRKQIEIDIEEQMKQLFDPMKNYSKEVDKHDNEFLGMDFGMGRATENYAARYLMNGIIL